MTLRNRLVADGLYTFAFRLANMALAAILGVVTARMLGPAGRGIYAIPMVDAGLVSAVFSGLASAMSFYLLRRDAGRYAIGAGFGAAAIGCLLGGSAVFAIAYFSHTLWAALPAVLSLPPVAMLQMLYGYCTGTHRVRFNTTATLLNTILLFALMLGAFTAFGHLPMVAIATWVVAGNAFAAGLATWMIVDSRKLKGTPVSAWSFIAYGARTGAVSLVSLLNYRADIYIVALLTTPAQLGMYSVAVAAAETLLTVTQVTAMVSSPHIGSLDERAAAYLAARCVRHNLVLSTLTCAVLALVAPIAVGLLYGAAFLPAVPALRVLLVGVVALSLGSPMSSYFTIRLGRPEVAFVLASGSACVCIGLSLLLVPRIGILGAAYASTAAYIVGQIASVFYFGVVARIKPAYMLVPRLSDLQTYMSVARSLFTRIFSRRREVIVP